MKVIVALGGIHYFRHFDKSVRHLCGKGHTVDITIRRMVKKNTTDRALQACVAQTSASFEPMPRLSLRRWSQLLLWSSRQLISYAVYFKPGHPSAQLAAGWAENYMQDLPKSVVNWIIKRPKVGKLLTSRGVQKVLRRIHESVPLDAALKRRFLKQRPDVVFASPFICEAKPREVEYIRTAKALKIPTVVAVASWDNLTTKGTFHVIPDMTLVWNKGILEEAVQLHNIPREKIIITGAPTFDFWFETKPSTDRASFCSQVGMNPDQPFIVYLCSSTSITMNEASFVAEFAAVMRAHPDTSHVNILVRPHPLNTRTWEGFQAENVSDAENVFIWPRGGEWPDSAEAQQVYYDTLYHSHAVIGINTSAFLEGACMDKPCVTVLTDNFRRGQMDRGHFRNHLLSAGFLEVAHSLPESAALFAEILCGRDAKAEPRRQFVKSFIRPRGLHRSPSEIIARIIEQAALGKSAVEIDVAIGVEDDTDTNLLHAARNGHAAHDELVLYHKDGYDTPGERQNKLLERRPVVTQEKV